MQPNTGSMAIVALVFVWPVLVGVLSLRGAAQRRAPGGAAFVVPAVVHILGVMVAAIASAAVFLESASARPTGAAWLLLGLFVLLGFAVVYLLGRGFRRAGWARWVHLMAGVWLFHLTWVILGRIADPDAFEAPDVGLWVLLLALGAAAPGLGLGLGRRA